MKKILQWVLGIMFLLHHRQVQPLWRKTRYLLVLCSFLIIFILQHVYWQLPQRNLSWSHHPHPYPEPWRCLAEKRKTERKHHNSDLSSCVIKLVEQGKRTHWRAAPGESGSTQSCQSRCGGPGCSGPRLSDAEGCWERSLQHAKCETVTLICLSVTLYMKKCILGNRLVSPAASTAILISEALMQPLWSMSLSLYSS